MSRFFATINDRFRSDAIPALLEYVSIRSLSPAFDHNWNETGEIERAIELIRLWTLSRQIPGIAARVSRIEGRTPALVIEVPGSNSTAGHVLIYGHLDKQPAEGPWRDGGDPFVATQTDDSIFGRGIADDGYSAFAALTAIEALAELGIGYPPCTLLIEASEESGSPDLDFHVDAVMSGRDDVGLVICLDSGGLDFDRLWVTTSLRGNLVLTVDVEVLDHGVHSGSAGGVVPSSFRVLRSLLSRVESEGSGEIIPSFLRSEIPEIVIQRAAELDRELKDPLSRSFPIAGDLQLMGDSGAERILNQTWRASLALTGIEGIPDIASGGNVLRSHTKAKISLRLPPNVDAAKAQGSLVKLLSADPPAKATVRVDGESPAQGWVAPELSESVSNALDAASKEVFDRAAGYCGEGGSIPFLATLGAKFPRAQIVATGVLGPGSNAHGPDESLRIPMAVGVSVAVAHLLSI